MMEFLHGAWQGCVLMWSEAPFLATLFFAICPGAPLAVWLYMMWAFWTGQLDDQPLPYRPVRRCVHWDRRQRLKGE